MGMKLEMRDPGMHPLSVVVSTMDEVIAELHKQNTSYVTAYLYDDGNKLILNAHRKLGERNWKIVLKGNS